MGDQPILSGIGGVFIACLCGCAASTHSSAAGEETALDCSIRSPTTCWTVSGRFPSVGSRPEPTPLDRTPSQPFAAQSSGILNPLSPCAKSRLHFEPVVVQP